MKEIFNKENTRGFENKAHLFKIISSTALICLFALIGLLFFFRPDTSESENRKLTEFPKFTWSSFISGEYFSQVSLWYSDTYPLREGMISANKDIQSLYGPQPHEIIIPPSTPGGEVENGGNVDKFGSIYLQKDTNTAFEIFFSSPEKTSNYISLINRAADSLSGKANVYSMVVPLHYTYRLTDEQISSLGASDCVEVIDSIYDALDDSINTIDVHSKLWEHRDEYIYFRTDHHWTARGAYYAYLAFCEQKGISPSSLEDYERLVYEGFLGTYYAASKDSSILSDKPDYVEAFIPNGQNKIDVISYNRDSKSYYKDWFYVTSENGDKYGTGLKYNCFIGGDNPVGVIHNESINDNSSIVVIKESYGNAFIPFLVDSYEYLYVIDYRYYTADCIAQAKQNGLDTALGITLEENLDDFVRANNISDVLFLNYITTTSTQTKIDQLSEFIG